MTKLNLVVLSAFAMGLATSPANAQELRGFRADASIAADRFYSEGNNAGKLGFGGSLGVDAFVGNNFVLGVEASLLNSRAENITRDGAGVAARKSFEEWGGALRAGVMTSPLTLVYGKVGVAWNEQRKSFDADAVRGDYYNHYNTRGLVIGGGVEHMLGDRFYVKAEGRYANYRTNSSRLTGLIGVGVLFGQSKPPVR
jgi:hypothetical protein